MDQRGLPVALCRSGWFAVGLALAIACGASRRDDSEDGSEGGGSGASLFGGSGGRGGSGTSARGGQSSGMGGEGGENTNGGTTARGGTTAGGVGGTTGGGTGGTGGGPCPNDSWGCKIVDCASEGLPRTTVSATVYDPAGRVPLYNVIVYVPNAPLAEIATGATCETCETPVSGEPIAAALTDATGRFLLENVPVGMNMPLVIQIGKWRREIVLPEVRRCQDNPFDNPDLFRLPRDQSEGHLPKIAVTTGESDQLECLLRRIGIDAAEFTNPDGPGRINLFTDPCTASDCDAATSSYASGVAFPSAYTGLWDSAASLRSYDMVLMSCTGAQAAGRDKTTAHKQALKDYVDSGGRVLLEHYHHAWLRGGNEAPEIETARSYPATPFPVVATWATPDDPNIGDSIGTTTATDYRIDTSFPKGAALADWLVNVGATPTRGTISLIDVKNPALAVEPVARRWIYTDTTLVAGVGSVPFFTVNTPIERASTPDQQCGRLAHTGIHLAVVAGDDVQPFSNGCVDAVLSPQEKAFEFLFFDVAACVSSDDVPPVPPDTM